MFFQNFNRLFFKFHTDILKVRFRRYSIDQDTEARVRVRFAPSPTGHIHLGGLRTAFYNYIFARKNNGQFVLRIEDTDQTRVLPGSTEDIEDVLNWSGLKPDESPQVGGKYGPYLQSKRLDLYKQHAQQLLELGRAYRCFCSTTRLNLMRSYQARNREKIRYDGKCRYLQPSEVKEKLSSHDNRHVIRFALAPGTTTFNDLVFGPITYNLVEALESDPIILKSDLYPTYHFANVIDDQAMRITHVLRGSEWISSTAKHIQLYEAFGWSAPKYVHFPLVTMRDGSKMSKRNNHSHVKSYIDAGYEPVALFNFLTNIGGGVPKSKQDSMELWTVDELIEKYDFQEMTCHPGSIDINRLNIYSAKELQKTWQDDPDKVIKRFKELLKNREFDVNFDADLFKSIMDQLVTRLITINDLLSQNYIFIWKQPSLSWDKQEYKNDGIDLQSIINDVIEFVKTHDILDKDKFIEKMKELSYRHEIGYNSFMRLLRKILTNHDTGLPVFEICNCLGRARLIEYLRYGLVYVST